MQEAGVPPNTVAYNCAIRSAATRDKWPVALSLLEDMRSDGVPRTVVSYNAALAACERGGAWEEAQCLLLDLEAEAMTDEGDEAVEGNGAAAVGSSRRADQSTAAAQRVLHPDLITYHTAIATTRKACPEDPERKRAAAYLSARDLEPYPFACSAQSCRLRVTLVAGVSRSR